MNSLGIYFGTQAINIVETKGRQLLNNVRVLRSSFTSGEPTEEKVPEEAKMIALLKNELRKVKIEAKEAAISLSGKDLIIRTFEMPILPRQELDSAINFEIRKYIPFKVEELTSGFQWKTDKTIQKNHVLFVGIKKETLNKYLNILKEVGIKAGVVEYSAFSILRLVKLGNIKDKGVIAIVNLDLAENDENNFVVLENGFPLFSRDITIVAPPQEGPPSEGAEAGAVLERLKREIRISLDYYDRTFPLKNIEKVSFIMGRDYRMELEAFIKDLGLAVQFINIEKCVGGKIGKPIPFSLSFLKGYCTSLSKIDIAPRINLLSVQEKAVKKAALLQPGAPMTLSVLVSQYKLDMFIFLGGLSICIVTFLFGILRIMPLQNEVRDIIGLRPAVVTVSPEGNYDQLVATDGNYNTKIKIVNEVIKKRLFFTEILDAIPRLVPEDIRLTELNFKKGEKTELTLRGIASASDSDKELESVNTLLASLKASPVFSKYFKEMVIASVDHTAVGTVSRTNFVISCRE